jgi:hypothetical protein
VTSLKSINFNQNIKSYAINGDENNVVRINTSDYGIFTRAKEKENEMSALATKASKAEEEDNLTVLKKVEQEVRDLLNYIFNADVCTPAFGNANCLSPCDGEFLFISFFDALMKILEEEMLEETQKFNDHVSKYTRHLAELTK